MHDHIPRSAIESAIHAENQAAANKPEQKGAAERVQELWGTFEKTPVGHGVMATRETLGKIFDAGVDIVRDAIAGMQNAYHTGFFGTRDFGHMHERAQPTSIHGHQHDPAPATQSIHDNAPVVEAIEKLPASFADIMRAQSELAPPRDEPAQEHDQGPER